MNSRSMTVDWAIKFQGTCKESSQVNFLCNFNQHALSDDETEYINVDLTLKQTEAN